MKDMENKKVPNTNRTKRSVRSERRDRKLLQDGTHKTLTAKETEFKSLDKKNSNIPARDSKVSRDSPEAYEEVVVHHVDDLNRFEAASGGFKTEDMSDGENKDKRNSHTIDLEKEQKQGDEEYSDAETIKDSGSSQGDSQTADEEKTEKPPKGSKQLLKNSADSRFCDPNKLHAKTSHKNSSNGAKSKNRTSKATTNTVSNDTIHVKVPSKSSSESSDSVEEKLLEDVKEVDVLDEVSNGAHIVKSDDEVANTENGDPINQTGIDRKVEELEMRVEKLEEELREVAALEIALYSVVPEHGSSAHKVHTPARRLSRIYIHACKHWSQSKRGTVARNIVSGLVLVAKSCSNDVSRLTFWLSNTVVLREIICQAFGSSCNSSSLSRISELNVGGLRSERKATSLKWKANYGGKLTNKDDLMQFMDDWQETRTLTTALEKVESWIFSRTVESIWWQTLTPNMQTAIENLNGNKTMGRLLGPALGDQQQGTFSINLWKSAFEDALRRLCPVRAGGHTCGCLLVLARMVMEQCITRLDVAMFNAILRESAHEIPTDPVSDPIVDSRVLPIPAGDLSFGSGAQLKNSVGNWSRRLTELFLFDANNSPREGEQNSKDDDKQGGDVETKHFNLLNELSDLLMLPKDMLMDRSIRTEVCPSVSLSLVKRILCNFTPDEFSPDSVSGAVLEALNAEFFIEQKFSADSTRCFPYTAPPVMYTTCPVNVAEKISEIGSRSLLARSSSAIQRKGYTSDDELEELESPLISLFDKSPSTTTVAANGNGKSKEQKSNLGGNARYVLLREVWAV